MRSFFKQWLTVFTAGALILVFGLVACRADSPPFRPKAWTIADMNAQIDASFFVVNHNCSGTLVKQGDEPVVLTAEHCVANLFKEFVRESVSPDTGEVVKRTLKLAVPGTITQLTFNGAVEVTEKNYRVKVLATDKKRDLAVVQALTPISGTPSRIACGAPVRGERVTVVGNPRGELYAAVGEGIVASAQRTYRSIGLDESSVGNMDQGLTQISSGVVGGNSGGPVYNAGGDIVGVVVLAHPTNEVLGFAVPLEEIHAFLKGAALGKLISHCSEKKAVDANN